jgi:putative Holliday junction resolvase
MRILGLDYGSRTVGVAVSDPLMITAQGVEIIRRDRESALRRTLARIEELIQEYEVDRIVLGLPLNMDDSEGPRAEATREFKEKLERRTGLPVILVDERLTTVEADEVMIEAGLDRTQRKKHVYRIAAQLILQDYMNSQTNRQE